MARHCTVCGHPKRGEINKDLLQTSDSNATVATRYGLVTESVRRHRNNHLQVTVDQVNDAQNALTVIGYAHDLFKRSNGVLDRAEQGLEASEGDPRSIQAAAASLREVRQSIELLARLVVTEPESHEQSTNDTLDAMIMEQLLANRLAELPAGTDQDIADAELLP